MAVEEVAAAAVVVDMDHLTAAFEQKPMTHCPKDSIETNLHVEY